MINRRDLLKVIGIGGLLPFVGKTEEIHPVELPVVQAPQVPSWTGLGSITVTGPARLVPIAGSGSPYDLPFYRALDPLGTAPFPQSIRANGGMDMRYGEYTRFVGMPWSEQREVIGVDANGYLVTRNNDGGEA